MSTLIDFSPLIAAYAIWLLIIWKSVLTAHLDFDVRAALTDWQCDSIGRPPKPTDDVTPDPAMLDRKIVRKPRSVCRRQFGMTWGRALTLAEGVALVRDGRPSRIAGAR